MSDQSLDPLAAPLRALAPTVDMSASRQLFEQERSGTPGSSRRWLLPAAVFALLVAGLVGVWAFARDGGGTVPADRVDPPGVDFEVLLVEETGASIDSIQTAASPAELTDVLAPIAGAGGVPIVDFDKSIVAVFNREGNACPAELIGFDIRGAERDVWSPRFRFGQGACDDIGLTWAYVVRFDRSAFGSSVTFRMPDDPDAAGEMVDVVDEPERGEEFEMIAVEETAVPFGTIRAAQSDEELVEWWETDIPGVEWPEVDFTNSFVVALTLPDDACPDILVQFRGDRSDAGLTWTPQFEPPPGGCNEPLITRTYVVRINRPPVPVAITFRLPADDIYGYDANELTVDVAATTVTIVFDAEPREPEPPMSEGTVTVLLPATGTAEASMTEFGPMWVVHHDDGTVSAHPAVVDAPTDDDTGVAGLARLVAWDAVSRTFSGRWLHDEFGRAVNGPRSDDLAGFEARTVGDSVEISRSEVARMPGDPFDVPSEGDHGLLPIDLGPLLELDVLPTLSFSGPTWRYLDASLVVENGTGELCAVDDGAPVPDLGTCGDAAVPTVVTSSQPEITSWFFGPVLAEFDEFGTIVAVAPLGGQASRNDGPESAVSDETSKQAGPDGHFDVLWVGPSTLPFGTLVVADDADSWTAWLAAANAGIESPQPIDFERSVAVAMSLPDDACPPDLAAFDVVDGALEPTFVEAEEACRIPLVSRTYVVAVDRSSIVDAAAFRLPGDETLEYGDAVARLPDESSGTLATPERLSRRGRPGDPAIDAFGVVIETVETACGVGLTPVVTTSLLASQPAEVVVEIVSGHQLRGRGTMRLRADFPTALEIPLDGALDADQQVVIRSAQSGAILTRLAYVGCG